MPPTTALNPFPAYPVVRLLEAATDVGASTVKTEAIRASRTFIDQYAEQWQAKRTDPNLRIEPLIVAVKGDYGTGKTHLLLDAIARLGKKLGTSSRAPVFVRVSCIGADPVTWFRAVIGPAL